MVLLCVVHEDGKPRLTPAGAPETRFMFLPSTDSEIIDTWTVGGLRGTGSHDVVVRNVFVPLAYGWSPHAAPSSCTKEAQDMAGRNILKASQRGRKQPAPSSAPIAVTRQPGQPVRWKERRGVFKRDVGDGVHSEVLIAERVYRVITSELD
jgi:hypothetical protein